MRCRILGLLILVLIMALLTPALAQENACTKPEEHLDALLAAKAASAQGKYTSFEIWVSEELKEELFANDFAIMTQLEL